MKTSVIGEEFRARYLSNPDDPEAFEGPIVVFDGPEDYHRRIDDPALGITPATLLFMRGTGPIGYPGAAEVVNMRPPAYLITEGVSALPCVGDGRQSGTSASPSILNASPEAAVMGGLALLKTGDRVRIDLKTRTVDVLIGDDELAARRARPGGAGRLCLSAVADAVAGDPALAGRAAGERRDPRRQREVPAHRADQRPAARQPLTGGGAGSQMAEMARTAATASLARWPWCRSGPCRRR